MEDGGGAVSEDTCGEVYSGPSFPEFHGEKCLMPKGHAEREPLSRHISRLMDNGCPVTWLTPSQKELWKTRHG
jgi:hypothetical protein